MWLERLLRTQLRKARKYIRIRSSNIGYNGMIAYDNMHYISALLTAWIVEDPWPLSSRCRKPRWFIGDPTWHTTICIHSHKFIIIELGKSSLLEFRGKLSTMRSFVWVVWESCAALFLDEIGKPVHQSRPIGTTAQPYLGERLLLHVYLGKGLAPALMSLW